MSKEKQRYEDWQENLDPDKPLILAATVVIVRDGDDGLEVLMVLRHKKLKFGGGSWVFPGGRVDEADYATADSHEPPAMSSDVPAAYVDVAETTRLDVNSAVADVDASPEKFAAAKRAAVRETLEETGLVLGIDDMACFSHWIPPPILPRRFATWFFVAAAPEDQRVVVDGGEITDYIWTRPQDKIRMRNSGKEDDMLPPTYVTLVDLASQKTVSELLEFAKARKPPLYATKMAKHGDTTVSLWASDAGYETGDADVPGPRHRLVMSDDNWEYQRPGG